MSKPLLTRASGTWTNSYGSIMSLNQKSPNVIIGTYQSSTGSTGKYYVIGHADPSATGDIGQCLALAISWRSFDGGEGDPSWHWVSGLSGQLVETNQVPTMYLMHNMVATTDFPGLASIGMYSDKLIYTPAKNMLRVPDTLGGTSLVGDPIEGEWVSIEEPQNSLHLGAPVAETGYLEGTLATLDGELAVHGFTDVHVDAVSTPVLQGLSVTALNLPASKEAHAECLSLAGRLDRTNGILSLLRMRSRGTTSANVYVQTKTDELRFRRRL